ncbi:MAG: two-component system, chemotaxis family, protein-glutamate methylesterase/glutaminase [Actinomycetota bacterium]|nr:two-component system, chemotaxis family, protein-glutamate methylesterase/glutaminase [Actinomycetota bacterium]
MTTRVVVVEDSIVQRAHLVRALQADGDIAVVGEAAGAVEAIEMVRSLRPDVVTLDLQIPDGGGQRVIEQVMASSPAPILVLSAAIADRESVAAVEALVAGAVDVVPKPVRWSASDELALRARVRLVSGVGVVRRSVAPVIARSAAPASGRSAGPAATIVAIGASTGGPAALAEVLSGLDSLRASVLIVQHLHEDFVGGLVSWMARAAMMPVELARAGDSLRPGLVTIAPGGVHLRVDASDRIVLDPLPPSVHRPSIDVLFSSLAARPAGRNVGVLLTGMGDDGAAGLLELRARGDVTIAQDEATSVVFGMPRAAQLLGAAKHVSPLEQIATIITKAVGR